MQVQDLTFLIDHNAGEITQVLCITIPLKSDRNYFNPEF